MTLAMPTRTATYRLDIRSNALRFIAQIAIRHEVVGRVVDSALDADVVVVDAPRDVVRVRAASPGARIIVWSTRRDYEEPAYAAGADRFACTLDGVDGLTSVL